MQIVADALLLAVARFEHFALELPPRRGVLQHGQPEALAAQYQRSDRRLDEQRAIAFPRAAHRELADQRRARARRRLVRGFGDLPVERWVAREVAQMFADQGAG